MDGGKFCESCGAKVIEEKTLKMFCSACGKPLEPDAAFCSFCGAKRNGAAPEQDPAAGQIPATPCVPASQGLPDYMQPGYQQRIRAEREAERQAERQAARNAAKTKKSTRVFPSCLSSNSASQDSNIRDFF